MELVDRSRSASRCGISPKIKMKYPKLLALLVSAIFLVACGGGGGAASGPGTPVTTPDDLTAASASAASSQGGSLCGVDVGANLLQGSVTNVHDGDTLTLNVAGRAYKVRLDSIDAPELAQPFGSLSQIALANAVLGKSVQVTYTQTDQYGRIVGAVFTDNCQYVNLTQVATGMAWFYRAYRCEVSAAVRSQFERAQEGAVAAKIGLWSQANPTAPWVYRNGVDPVAPTCSS